MSRFMTTSTPTTQSHKQQSGKFMLASEQNEDSSMDNMKRTRHSTSVANKEYQQQQNNNNLSGKSYFGGKNGNDCKTMNTSVRNNSNSTKQLKTINGKAGTMLNKSIDIKSPGLYNTSTPKLSAHLLDHRYGATPEPPTHFSTPKSNNVPRTMPTSGSQRLTNYYVSVF